jgi:hypothetical protein
MSLNERVQQLSETIVQEVRGPVERALRELLTDILRVAAEDHAADVTRAVAEATASQAATFEAERQALLAERDQSTQSQMDERVRSHDAAIADLRGSHDAAIAELRGAHEAAVSELLQQHTEVVQQHELRLADLQTSHDEALRQHGEALSSQQEEAALAQAQALDALRTSLGAEHQDAIAALQAQAAEERERAVTAATQQLEAEHLQVLQEIRLRIESDRESAMFSARTAAEAAGAAAMTAALAAVEQEKRAAETRATEAEETVADAEARLSEAQARAGTAEAKLAEVTAQAAEAAAKAAEAEAWAAELSASLESVRAEAQAARGRHSDGQAVLDEARITERHAELACTERVLDAVRRIDAAGSLTEVLDAFSDHTAAEAGRVAIMLVDGARLKGWRMTGVADAEAAAIALPLEVGSVLERAVATGIPVSTSDLAIAGPANSSVAINPPAGRVGIAVPISVGGRVVALAYVDDSGRQTPVVPSNWPEIAEILARHAGQRLEVLTVSHASRLATRVQQEREVPEGRPVNGHALEDDQREVESARRYARLLISEIKLYNEAAVEQGRHERDLLARLGPDIDRARRLYEEKIPASVRQRVDCFDEEVLRTLAGGDRGLLGHVS